MSNAAELHIDDIEELLPLITERYTFIDGQPIGRPSGFGAVWKAYDTWLKRDVAIKISDSDMRDEVRLCHDIEGQTVRVYDYYMSNGWYAYSMELLQSPWKTLDDIIDERAHSKRTLQHYFDCFQIAYAVLEALSRIHGRPYSRENRHVHADIQPRNVFVRWDPRPRADRVFRLPQHVEYIKIIDLGISVKKGERHIGRHPNYGNPKSKMAHQGDDLYCLAVMFLELITGERPSHSIMEHSARISDHVIEHSSGSIFIDNITSIFANDAARAGSNRSITAHSMIRDLENMLFDIAPLQLLALKALSDPQCDPLNKTDMAEFLFYSLKGPCGWQYKTEERLTSLKELVRRMTDEGQLICKGHKYSIGV